MKPPVLPLDIDKAFGVPRPAPKPSQGNKKTKGRKPKEAADGAVKT